MNKNLNVRTTAVGTVVKLARTGSLGLAGTRANMDHHAQACKAFVDTLVAAVENIPFKQWTQGHNVHTFVTRDGRQYRFRPLHDGVDYIGLELFEVLPGGTKHDIMQVKDHSTMMLCMMMLHHLAEDRIINHANSGANSERMVA